MNPTDTNPLDDNEVLESAKFLGSKEQQSHQELLNLNETIGKKEDEFAQQRALNEQQNHQKIVNLLEADGKKQDEFAHATLVNEQQNHQKIVNLDETIQKQQDAAAALLEKQDNINLPASFFEQ